MMKKISVEQRNLAWSSFPPFLLQAVNLFLLPAYTRVFDTNEFGYLAFTVSAIGVLQLVLVPSTTGVYIRYGYLLLPPRGVLLPTRNLSTIAWIHLGLVIFGTLCSLLLVLLTRNFFLADIPKSYLGVGLGLFASSTLTSTILAKLQAQNRMDLYSKLRLGSVLIALFCSVAGVFLLKMGPVALLLGELIGQCFILPWSLPLLLRLLSKKPRRAHMQFLLPAFIATGPENIAFSAMNAVDRFAIKFYLGASALGIYAVSYYAVSALMSVVFVLSKQWKLFIFDWVRLGRLEEVRELYRLSMHLVSLLCILFAFGGTLFIPYLVDQRYASLGEFLPLMMLIPIFRTQHIFVRTSLWALSHRRTIFRLSVMEIGVMIGLNLLLVRNFGLEGAIYATILTLVSWPLFKHARALWHLRPPSYDIALAGGLVGQYILAPAQPIFLAGVFVCASGLSLYQLYRYWIFLSYQRRG